MNGKRRATFCLMTRYLKTSIPDPLYARLARISRALRGNHRLPSFRPTVRNVSVGVEYGRRTVLYDCLEILQSRRSMLSFHHHWRPPGRPMDRLSNCFSRQNWRRRYSKCFTQRKRSTNSEDCSRKQKTGTLVQRPRFGESRLPALS